MKNIKRVAAATIITTAGLGLAGLGAASVDGEPHDAGHWHGPGPWHP